MIVSKQNKGFKSYFGFCLRQIMFSWWFEHCFDPGLISRIKKTDLQYNTLVNFYTVKNISLVVFKNSSIETAKVLGQEPGGEDTPFHPCPSL